MTTARDLITRSFKLAGILTKTETPSSDEVNDALTDLNSMLSSWSNESMSISSRTLESFSLVSGDAEYTIGTGQDFNTTKPTYIVDAYIRLGAIDYPVSIITDESYADIDYKSARARPYFVNYNNAHPYGTLKFYPTPDMSYTLYLLTEKAITSLAIDDDIVLPSGWEDAIAYNLAVRLKPQYGQPIDEATVRLAMDTKGAIQRQIMKSRSMDANPLTGRKNNVFNGWFR